MSLTAHSKSTGFLLACLVFGFAFMSQPEAHAQSRCYTCFGQQGTVPIYLQFGVDPYHPREVNYMPFTPLQTNLYQAPRLSTCLPSDTLVNANPVVVVPGQAANAMGEPEVVREIPAPDSKPNASSENTISSPSDILLSPKKSTEPTLADDSSSENMAQLDRARRQIARLKAEIAEAKEQARVSIERAYAAEKAANAANTNAEKSRKQLMDERQRMTQVAEDKVDELMSKLRELEKVAAAQESGARTKSSKGKSDAEKRVADLYSDAKKAGQPKNKKPTQPKRKTPVQPKKKKADESKKKKAADVPVQQQIKSLRDSMERQIKNTSARIRKRNQAAIQKLIDAGKKDSDPEVRALKKKMDSELKENQAKIKKRVEDRINRLRKEAAARSNS